MWTAYYSDGTTLPQEVDGKLAHAYKDIDQSKIEKFVVDKLIVDIPKGWRLIYRARHFMRSDGTESVVHIVGAQAKDCSGKQFISLLYSDGRVVTTDRFRPDLAELAPPVLMEGEEWAFTQ
jgi:hypothetical protein